MNESEIEAFYNTFFPCEGINCNTRDLILYIIGTSKELTLEDHIYGVAKKPFQLYSLNMKKDNGCILYRGILSNGEENKMIDGKIVAESKGISSFINYMNVLRLCEHISEDKKAYALAEKIIFLKDKTKRKTIYSDSRIFDEEYEPYDTVDSDSFIENLALSRKFRK